MAINRDDFARTCVDDTLDPVIGVSPHYLVAAAQILSGISDDKDGDRIGPFRVRLADWRAYGFDAALQITLLDDDINDPMMQCMYAALQTLRAQKSLQKRLGRLPSPDELYSEWPKDPPTTDAAIQAALDSTKDLINKAIDAALADLNVDVPGGDINLNSIPADRRAMATLIIGAFAAAGYGKVQQIAAVANAIAESGLNPKARLTTSNEDSVGLFQLNMKGGVGTGYGVSELEDPTTNTDLIIEEAKRNSSKFKAAMTVQDAVAAFVTDVERPANAKDEIVKRIAIAQKLIA